MSDFYSIAKNTNNAEKLARLFLQHYFKDQEIIYPLNPFQMLIDEGVYFAIRDFGKLEGVYIPAEDENDISFVGINLNRPITRQRFTAAHELCHFLKDSDKQICPVLGKKTAIERFADQFASAVLMPIGELQKQVDCRKRKGYVSFDDVLEIADYFGVSFDSCVYRIAYLIHAIEGNTEPIELKKRIRKYKPDAQRKNGGYNNVRLYEGLLDSYEYALRMKPSEFILNVFQNNYIYNDSRMEGIDIDLEVSSEIVTDIRLGRQSSKYCKEENEAYLSIAGHAEMYSYIFQVPSSAKCSVFDIITLHKKLYSCFPYPEYGGKIRDNNTLVTGAKFETVDYKLILSKLLELDEQVKNIFDQRNNESISTYIKKIVQIHHELTVIHPFCDGNGRTLRAFFNQMMVKNQLTPIYIKVENKEEYFAALEAADKNSDYAPLFEFFARAILRSNVELTR